MALAKRENQLSVSAIPKQSARESDRKRNVKVLDEETYVQVRAADNTLNLANITKIFSQIFRYLVRGNIKHTTNLVTRTYGWFFNSKVILFSRKRKFHVKIAG